MPKECDYQDCKNDTMEFDGVGKGVWLCKDHYFLFQFIQKSIKWIKKKEYWL